MMGQHKIQLAGFVRWRGRGVIGSDLTTASTAPIGWRDEDVKLEYRRDPRWILLCVERGTMRAGSQKCGMCQVEPLVDIALHAGGSVSDAGAIQQHGQTEVGEKANRG